MAKINWRAIILREIVLTVALAALALIPHAPAAHALAGEGAWCIVTDEGNTHCNYATSQECLAAVAGTRGGFCNENSSGGAAPAASEGVRRSRKGRP